MNNAEKLIILRETGNALLSGLGTTKKILSTPGQKPALFNDPSFSKILAGTLKKFPDVDNIEKIQGYDQLTSKSKILYPEIEPFYFYFVDSCTFKDHTLQLLNDIGSNTVEMKIETNPSFLVAFMEVFRIYVQINLLIHDIMERKQLIGVFSKLYKAVKLSEEPNYSKVASWVASLDNPVKTLQNDFRSLTNFLGKTLVDLAPAYQSVRGLTLLRKNGTLNLALKPEEMDRPVTDKLRFHLIYSEQIYLWITYGFLLCPDSLPLPGALELNCSVLKEGFVLPIFHSSTVQLATEFESIWTGSKNKTFQQAVKQKKLKIKEIIDESGSKSAQLHKTRRTYIRQELSTLLSMFQDTPALAAPKFQIALSGLNLAKEEIFWYLRHNNKEAKATSKRFARLQENEFYDASIVELIALTHKLKQFLLANKQIVSNYYVEYLKVTDSGALAELIEASGFKEAMPSNVVKICADIQQQVLGATPETDFRTLRMNWLRAESSLSSIKSPVKLSKHQNLLDRMQLIMWHSRYATEFYELLDEYGSLKELWYWKDTFSELFANTVKSNYASHTDALLNILEDFPANGSIYNPTEREEIGKQIVHMSETFIGQIGKRMVDLIHALVKNNLTLDSKLEDTNAVLQFQMKKPEWKPPTKNWTPPQNPGSESEFRERKAFSKEISFQKNLQSLAAAVQKVKYLIAWNTRLDLTACLIDSLTKYCKQWVRSAIQTEVPDEKHKDQVNKIFTRPSMFLRQLRVFIHTFTGLEQFLDFDSAQVLKQVLRSELYIPAVGPSGSLDHLSTDETEIKYQNIILGHVIEFYKSFLEKHLIFEPQGIHVIWSDVNHCFYSKAQHPFKAEQYADILEMRALCSFIGPDGVKLLDREVLKFILKNVSTLKDILTTLKPVLIEFSTGYRAEQTTAEILKKVKPVTVFDQLLQTTVAIGHALKFREILLEGLAYSTTEYIPLISNLIRTCVSQYESNLFSIPELVNSDCLAFEVGFTRETADQGLKKFLRKSVTGNDEALWDLLPVAYAAAFTSNFWKQAVLKPSYGAHNNGANILAPCIGTLITTVKTLTATDTLDIQVISNQIKTFIEISSVLLLRMGRSTKPDKHSPADYSSMLIFLDQFVTNNALVTSKMVEAIVPYSKLRNEWRQIFTFKGKSPNFDQF